MHSSSGVESAFSVIVNDAREFSIPDAGLIVVEDAESGEIAEIDTSNPKFRAEARLAARRRVDNLKSQFSASGCDLIEVDATQSVIDPLLAFFKQRQKKYR